MWRRKLWKIRMQAKGAPAVFMAHELYEGTCNEHFYRNSARGVQAPAKGSTDVTPADQSGVAIPYSCRFGDRVDGVPRFRYFPPHQRTWLHTYEYQEQLRGEDEGKVRPQQRQELVFGINNRKKGSRNHHQQRQDP